jgi:hypothetical protein
MANGNAEPEANPLIPKKQVKKPYVKPAFRYEQVFVTSALSCGKVQPTEFNCTSANRKAS